MANSFPDLVQGYLYRCFTQGTPPRADELARFLGMSRTTLNELFAEYFDETPAVYLKRAHIEYVKGVLVNTGDTIKLIAKRAGFGNDRSLYRLFQHFERTTPTQYRRKR
jgi:AraC-like DNA-binding protein